MCNSSLERWRTGDAPMPVINLLRFCNTFDVPLSAFIRNSEDTTEPAIEYAENDKWSPTGGYISSGEKTTPGSRTLRDPLDVTPIQSVVPGIVETSSSETAKTEHTASSTMQPEDDANAKITKLLDIIIKQQDTITYLTRKITAMQNNTFGMVAEDFPMP